MLLFNHNWVGTQMCFPFLKKTHNTYTKDCSFLAIDSKKAWISADLSFWRIYKYAEVKKQQQKKTVY